MMRVRSAVVRYVHLFANDVCAGEARMKEAVEVNEDVFDEDWASDDEEPEGELTGIHPDDMWKVVPFLWRWGGSECVGMIGSLRVSILGLT